ncbi:phosphotransferase enzyme family protein [Nocardia sp. NPDC060259]|uniref:phosphotransferase enzyme family protein n=1 Tax=Nocardia sp. NPDC060259 TaxID=3347088 RepID=UPI003650F344
MIVNRRDSRDITEHAEQELLKAFGLAGTEPLGMGTESRTYTLDDDRVLKIYADPAQRDALNTLQDFYSRLSAPDISWQLPHIHSITEHGELLAVIEQRIPGQPMEAFTTSSNPTLESLYLKTVAELGTVTLDPPLQRRMLLASPAEPSAPSGWNEFLTATVTAKLHRVLPALRHDLSGIDDRADQVLARLASQYRGPEGVIHGDIYPGNILMHDEDTVSGLIDFGTFTMIGDPLYDTATAASFYRMYEHDRTATRDRLLNTAASDLSAERRHDLYTYLLVNALLTCDLYPEPDTPLNTTGHYQWAAEILNTDTYWHHATESNS